MEAVVPWYVSEETVTVIVLVARRKRVAMTR